MAGINSGILRNAYPLSATQVREAEKDVILDNKCIAYLDENNQICFAWPNDPEGIKRFAWHNAYQIFEQDGSFIKKVYQRTGLTTFEHSATLTKQSIDDPWQGDVGNTFKYKDTVEENGCLYTYMGYETLEELREGTKPEFEAMAGLPWADIVQQFGNGDEEYVWNMMGITADTFIPVEPNWSVWAIDTTIAGDIIVKGELYNAPVTIKYPSFQDCSGITSVTVTDGMNDIPGYAFSKCSGLKNIIIPNSVTNVDSSVFPGCSSVEQLTIPFVGETPMPLSLFGTKSYDNSYSAKHDNTTYYIPNSLKTITISGGSIDGSAFSTLTSLQNINISDEVTGTINNTMFKDGKSFTNIVIGDGITGISDNAFANCSGITDLTIGKGITSIGQYAFDDCSNLTSIYFNATNCTDLSNNTSAFTRAGKDIDGITVTFGDAVERIPAYLFHTNTVYHPNIKEVIIGNSVVEIGEAAFQNCENLANVTIGNNVTSIGRVAFEGCYNLKSITIPDSVTNIGYSAFDGCTGLTSVEIPDSVTSLGIGAFCDDTQLVSVTIGNGIENIPGALFSYCTSLTNIIFNGTTTQWNALTKGDHWNYKVPATHVQCSDGQVAL